MFKVGDWVVAIHDCNAYPWPTPGNLFQVISAETDWIGVKTDNIKPPMPGTDIYSSDVLNGNVPNWGNHLFRLAKKEEIDRYNFPNKLQELINS